jgi:hypothetical protein
MRGRRAILLAAIALAAALGPAASLAISRAGATAPTSAPLASTTTTTTITTRPKTTPAPPMIRPKSGKPYAPALGDWEGTAGGYPASFSLLSEPGFMRRFGTPAYGFQDLVLLVPNACPPSASNYLEDLLTLGQPSPVRRRGDFGLTQGFGGGLLGARSASLSAAFDVSAGGCRGKLTWHMHPARRTPVQDGAWRAQFADGESGGFRVIGGGRVATSLQLPAELKPCRGPFGSVDLFIGAGGTVAVSQPDLRVSISFTRTRATGRLTVVGGTCAQNRFALSAKLRRPGP